MIDIISKIVQLKIITNIVSGIILFFILKSFFQWFSDIIDLRRVQRANKKLMELLKPYIGAGNFPEKSAFYALMHAVATEYHIKIEELNSVPTYFQQFVKEILEDPYLTSDKKIEYSSHLQEQIEVFEKEPIDLEAITAENIIEEKREFFNKNNQLNVSIVLSGFFIGAAGFLSKSYDLFGSIGIFLVVVFAVAIFADLVLKKKRYKEIPRITQKLHEKWKVYHGKRMKVREEKKRAEAELQVTQDKKLLEEEREQLATWQQQLQADEIKREALEKQLKELQAQLKAEQEQLKINQEQLLKSQRDYIEVLSNNVLSNSKEALVLEKSPIMTIRQERKEDEQKVYEVVQRAFKDAKHSDGKEQDLVTALKKSESFIPNLSLVCERNNQIVGYILFTKATVGEETILVLAPLAVLPEYQGLGIGSSLIEEGHKIAKSLGYEYSCVLGDPQYYQKFQYVLANSLGIEVPQGIPSENLMAIKLKEDAVKLKGKIVYAKEFGL